jgi:hypothetical protein
MEEAISIPACKVHKKVSRINGVLERYCHIVKEGKGIEGGPPPMFTSSSKCKLRKCTKSEVDIFDKFYVSILCFKDVICRTEMHCSQ